MKKLIYVLVALVIVSCANEPKDYVTFSGKITDKNSDSIVIRTRGYSKTISVNEDGTFSDTLKVTSGVYSFFDGKESTSIFLQNGYDINMTLDTKMFDETAKYTGNGAESSNFLAARALLQEKMFDENNFKDLDSIGLNTKFTELKSELTKFYNSSKGVDTLIINNGLKSLEPMLNYYKGDVLKKVAMAKDLPKGGVSPTFNNYENYKGGKTSLSDLKGKYVYVDIWATWCGPCKAEIPFLKKVEKAYHDKNIEFVSISIDTKENHNKWIAMVKEKELGGIQLFADADWKSKFVTDYYINSIPRFILIDPNGNIVSTNAPRPSSEELIKLFDEENI